MPEEKKPRLSESAYGGIAGKAYEPYVPSAKTLPEATFLGILMGALFSLVFAATNAYLGLKVGMTVSASIPGAVLATAVTRALFRRRNILETNYIQASGAAGESVASGIIFTLPALIIWGFADQFTMARIFTVAALGTILGVLYVVPLRASLTVDEHGTLPYPEGMAAAEVLVAGQADGSAAKDLTWGTLAGGGFKFSSGALALFKEQIEWTLPGIRNGIFGLDIVASLLGVGYIVGLEIGLFLFAGAALAWLVLIPLISYFGAGAPAPIFPGQTAIAGMNAWEIWSNYIRYIGAGAVAAGGFISLARSLPLIASSFLTAVSGLAVAREQRKRTSDDIRGVAVFAGVLGVFAAALLVPQMQVSWVGALSIILFGFFFAAVSARTAGLVGVSNLPVSGMTIAALLVSTLLLRAIGVAGDTGMIAAITTGGTICVAIAVAGSMAQNLKTGFILGATPKNIQTGVIIGGIVSAVAVGWVIIMLHQAYGIGSDKVPAPQATLMALAVDGVMTGTLPWDLVVAGLLAGVVLALLRLPVLPVAIGLYLPLHLCAGVLAGGIVRRLADRRFKGDSRKEKAEKGVLFASGLIAGDALTGIVIAYPAFANTNLAVFSAMPLTSSPWWGLAVFIMLALTIYRYITAGKTAAAKKARP